MSSHLPYSSYVGRTTNKYGGSSYTRTSSAPSTTNSLDRPSRAGSYGTTNTARSSSYSRFGGTKGYSVEPERPKSPDRRVIGLRMGSSSRFGAQIARSPISEKSSTVFGVSPRIDEDRLTLVTRATSPTPPSNSSFLRAKRADQEHTLTTEVPKPSFRPISVSSVVQTEELKEVSPPALERKIPTSRPWAQRVPMPRYSTAGGYSFSRREPEKVRVGGFGLRPEPTSTSTVTSPTRELPSKLPVAELHTSSVSRTDPLGNVNKDFRKSVLNMDLSSANDSQEKSSLTSIKPRSNLKLVLNKSPTSITVTQANGKTTKKVETSSSDETSSSEESSSEDSDEGQTLKPPSPKFTVNSRNSGDEALQQKPPASPKSVVVKTLPPVAAPMKVQLPQESKNEETKKPFTLRKLDSSDKAWWAESQKDIPGAVEAMTSPVKKSPTKISLDKESAETIKTNNKGYSLRKFDSTDKPWWNESTNDIPNLDKPKVGIKKAPSRDKLPIPTDQPKPSSQSDSDLKSSSLGKLSKSRTKSDIPKSQSLNISSLTNNISKPSPPQSETDSKSIGLSKLYKSGSKTDVSKSITSSTASLNNVTVQSPTQSDSDSKSIGLNTLYRIGSKSDLSKTSSSVSLNKLAKTGSQKSLIAKPPSPPTRRSDVLDPPKEFTPGLLRIHGERQYSPRLPRVESGLREWWLSEEELEEKRKETRMSLGEYSGPFKDIDHVLGNAAPPPAAFRTPNTSEDDSDSSDDEWYRQIKNQTGTNGPVLKANGETKVC